MRTDWIEVEIGKVSSLYQPKTIATSVLMSSGKYPVYGANGIIGRYDKYNHEESELLITCRGATCGNVHITKPYSWINGNAMVVKPFNNSLLSKEYLRLFFSQKGITKDSITGSAQPQITRSSLSPIKFPIAPLPEQRAIVARIEELFSELDHAVSSLQSAQAKLEIYRQSVLKKAFEGGFTENWIKKNDSDAWKNVALGDVAEISRGKSRHRPRNDERLFGGPYPFIQTGDVKAANGGLIKKFTQTYSEFGLEQSRLWPKGTLCLTIAANIADTAFLGIDACFPDSVVGIKTDLEILDLKFLNLLIQKLKNEIDSKASATAQKNINVEFLEKLEIPLPAIGEQLQIVQEIESRLSVADKLAETIQTNLQKSEALRQSILKKAFEGRLLSEAELEACRKEADWEPAERLLEKIKSEKKKK